MFSGPNSRTLSYLDCNGNSGSSKGHMFHGSCLARYLTTPSRLAIECNPTPYKCPVCR